ncbi:taste receptor type 2 member 39-like [Anomaloglossus baeobatrachus]|uniref:taste receptor type 2 member 39-like n=1 Tax=Anomaloglossus baeobatrachus TaxID=238106 RepID=UPI003F5012D2
MNPIETLVTVGIYICFLVTGVIGNLFILTVHFLDWLKTRDSNPSILIINIISLINIFFQGTITFHRVTSLMFLELFRQGWVAYPLITVLGSLAFSSLWSSTCLCFYYCIKIANFGGSFFYKLKTKSPVFIPWLLIISMVVSWSLGLVAYFDLYRNVTPVTVTGLATGNITSIIFSNFKSRCKCLFQTYMLAAAVAFVIIFLTAGAIVTSLCKHMIQMKKSNEGSGNSRIHSHLSVAKTVTSLLLLYLLFYGCMSVLFMALENYNGLIFALSFIVGSGFPTFNSIILIAGNRKLLSNVKKLLGMKPAITEDTVTTQ